MTSLRWDLSSNTWPKVSSPPGRGDVVVPKPVHGAAPEHPNKTIAEADPGWTPDNKLLCVDSTPAAEACQEIVWTFGRSAHTAPSMDVTDTFVWSCLVLYGAARDQSVRLRMWNLPLW